MDVGRRHETLVSETTDLITTAQHCECQHICVSSPCPTSAVRATRWGPVGVHRAEKPTIFIAGNKQACSLSRGGGIVSSLRTTRFKTPLGNGGRVNSGRTFHSCYVGTHGVLCLLTTTKYPRGSPEFQPSSAPWMARVRHPANCNNFCSFYPVA